MLPDRLAAYRNAPLAELLTILLRQYRRPLAGHGIHLSDREAEALAGQIAANGIPDEQTRILRGALIALIEASKQTLARYGLTFQQSLDAEMTDIPGWETTAEFLEIANEKANAELRISTGAALLTALGDARYAADLLFLVERGEDTPSDGDLDAVIARRALLFASGIKSDDPNWRGKLQAWVERASTQRREG
jgi:hypothetical protein